MVQSVRKRRRWWKCFNIRKEQSHRKIPSPNKPNWSTVHEKKKKRKKELLNISTITLKKAKPNPPKRKINDIAGPRAKALIVWTLRKTVETLPTPTKLFKC